MFKVGDKVRVKDLPIFSSSYYRTMPGKVVAVDSSDNFVRVELGFDKIWFLNSEVEFDMMQFDSVGKAVECLISQGFKVTLEKV